MSPKKVSRPMGDTQYPAFVLFLSIHRSEQMFTIRRDPGFSPRWTGRRSLRIPESVHPTGNLPKIKPFPGVSRRSAKLLFTALPAGEHQGIAPRGGPRFSRTVVPAPQTIPRLLPVPLRNNFVPALKRWESTPLGRVARCGLILRVFSGNNKRVYMPGSNG